MPRIRFTVDPKLPRDLAHLDYKKGQEVDLPDDQANRWLRRGVAVVVAEAPAAAAELPLEPEEAGAVEIPQDWDELHHSSRIALARRLTDDPVDTAADADRVIADEIERRRTTEHHPV